MLLPLPDLLSPAVAVPVPGQQRHAGGRRAAPSRGCCWGWGVCRGGDVCVEVGSSHFSAFLHPRAVPARGGVWSDL